MLISILAWLLSLLDSNLQLIYLHRILIPKWRLADKKLEDKDTEGPPVNSSTVSCWSQIDEMPNCQIVYSKTC